jgi:hypothetical protein
VFYVELAHPRQAARCVLAFRNAMRWAFKRWSVKQPVLFKGTCWLAGFPVANAALPMTDLHDDGITQRCDFIGPQIDLGFRLKDRSSPRQCTISVELAALIAKNAPNELRFFVEQSTPLKGALKGRPYPWIWIDCFDQPDVHAGKLDIHDLEDRLLKREMVKPHDLEAFCLAYIKEVGRPLHVPFVYGQPQGFFTMPDQYETALREARTA